MITQPRLPHLHPVSVDGVQVRYGGKTVIAGADLQPRAGITALLGHNGSGKSSLLRVLAGVQRPSAGSVSREGVDVHTRPTRSTHRARTGWLPQHPGMPPAARVRPFVEYVAWHRQIPTRGLDAEVDRVLDLTDTHGLAQQRLGTLSGGQRQRVALAAALLGDPDLLLLDEPTSGLDPSQREAFYAAVGTSAAGRAVILSTHLIEDVLASADDVMVLLGGVLQGPVALAQLVDRDDPAAAMAHLRSLMGGGR